MSGTIKVAALAVGGGSNNMQEVFKNCAQYTDCISETNITQIGNAKDTGVVIPMYHLMKYSDNYSNTSGSCGNTKEMNQL